MMEKELEFVYMQGFVEQMHVRQMRVAEAQMHVRQMRVDVEFMDVLVK